MQILSIEDEFENRKAKHKRDILKVMLMDYFYSLGYSKTQLERLADIELHKMLCTSDITRFNSLYEQAWQKLVFIFD